MVASVRNIDPTETEREALLSSLTDAAYRVALRHGIKGSFLDVQLELWQQLREVLRSTVAPEAVAWRR